MKWIVVILVLLLGVGQSIAQNERNIWPMGSKYESSLSIINNFFIDFNYLPPVVYLVEEFENTGWSYSLYCNPETGDLLFFSNGLRIIDNQGQIIENCDSINYGEYWRREFEKNNDSHPTNSQGYFIPMGNDSIYFIHQHLEWPINKESPGIDTTHFTLIVKNNASDYYCILKNKNIKSGSMKPLNVVRHGNGIDWWIVIPDKGSNNFSKFILSSSGVKWHSDQKFGYEINNSDEDSGGLSCFNLTGDKYAYYNNFQGTGTQIFDFDRCTGLFSNPVHIPLSEYYNGGANLAFSPNGRFLYVPTFEALIQYDVLAEDVAASGDTVAVRDLFVCLPDWPFAGGHMVITMGPDNKMYITPGNANNCLTVVNRPNLRGKACDVRQHGIMTPGATRYALPGIINYQLGPLKGSPCDPDGG